MTTTKKLSSLQQAHAVRIYGFCKPLDWDVSIMEVSQELNIDRREVATVVKVKGWTMRDGHIGNENSGRFSADPRPVWEMMQ